MKEAIIITRFIGIDPGVTAGLSVWDANRGRLELITSFDFFSLLHYLLIFQKNSIQNKITFAVRIEDPRGNRPTFNDHQGDDSRRIHDRISQNVGSNKRDAQLIAEFCQRHDIIHFLVRPDKKSLTKLSPEEFNRRFNYSGKSNQHARDSAGLVIGMTPIRYRPDLLSSKAPGPLFLPG